MEGEADEDTRRLLSNVATELFGALASDLVRCMDRGGAGRTELACQLRAELKGAPTLARLRELWRVAGALETGVLGSSSAPGRGYREVSVLWHASQAYQVVTGELTTRMAAESAVDQKQSLKWARRPPASSCSTRVRVLLFRLSIRDR